MTAKNGADDQKSKSIFKKNWRMLSQRRRRAKVWYPPNEGGGRCSEWKTKKMLTKKRCEIYLTQCKVIEAGREECARKEITPPPQKKGGYLNIISRPETCIVKKHSSALSR